MPVSEALLLGKAHALTYILRPESAIDIETVLVMIASPGLLLGYHVPDRKGQEMRGKGPPLSDIQNCTNILLTLFDLKKKG